MSKYKCDACADTGWYGDNGPGLEGNSEHVPCDQCDRGKDRKNQARAIRVDSPLRRFTNAMHEAAGEDDTLWEICTDEQLSRHLMAWVANLNGADEEQVSYCATRLALITAEIAKRVE